MFYALLRSAVLVSAALACLPAASAGEETLPILRTVEAEGLGRLPAMKLVVRQAEALVPLGLAEKARLDFATEMGLFVSLGPAKNSMTGLAIKKVRKLADKLVVETEEYKFEDLLGDQGRPQPYHFVVVPRSDLPVEGFVEKVASCPGLCALGTIVPVAKKLEFIEVRRDAKGHNYTVRQECTGELPLKPYDWLESICYDVSLGEGPGRVMCRFRAIKRGGWPVAGIEVVQGEPAAKDQPAPKPAPGRPKPKGGNDGSSSPAPFDLDKVAGGVRAAYGQPQWVGKMAADQILASYRMRKPQDDVPAIGCVEIDVEKFRKFIGSDGKTFEVPSGTFMGTIDEIGKSGSIRWQKPFLVMEKSVSGLGKVSVGYSELGFFQMKVEEVKVTDAAALRAKAKECARELGLKLTDEALAKMQFSFYVLSSK